MSFPVIVLWAHPRSMSTAIERIMRERGDCHCLHEPFMYYYYVHLGTRQFPHFDVEQERPSKFDDIVTLFNSEAQTRPVFIKDMAYYVLPEITEHASLASQWIHAFLIRDPRKSLMSYHRLDPEFDLDEVGLESQWNLYQWIEKHTGHLPLVLQAEQIQADPQAVVGSFWRYCNLPFVEQAFHWQSNELPEDWQQVNQWHQKTVSNTQIEPDQRSNAVIQQEFEEYAEKFPQLHDQLAHHWPYYVKLRDATKS